MLENRKGKRKSLVIDIPAMKKLVLDINWFHSMIEVLLRCFFFFFLLDLVGKIRLKLRNKKKII